MTPRDDQRFDQWLRATLHDGGDPPPPDDDATLAAGVVEAWLDERRRSRLRLRWLAGAMGLAAAAAVALLALPWAGPAAPPATTGAGAALTQLRHGLDTHVHEQAATLTRAAHRVQESLSIDVILSAAPRLPDPAAWVTPPASDQTSPSTEPRVVVPTRPDSSPLLAT